MMRPLRRLGPTSATIAILAAAICASACDRPPSGDVKDWTPADHDRAEDKQRIAQGGQPNAPNAGGGASASQQNAAAIIEATWKQQCTTCHGGLGKGDGPNSPMFKPADLTREEWQAKVSDADIANVIRNGKGKMPKFELPDPILQGVVARIRFYRGK
jgi:mono/diheme cytochrome c family protein